MKRVVMESPLAGHVTENVRYGLRCLLDCFRRHEAPFAGHLLYAQPGVLNDTIPEERELGMVASAAWDHAAELAVVYVDRGAAGMIRGVVRHRRHGIVIECRRLDGPGAPAVVDAEDYLCTCAGGPPSACLMHADPWTLTTG